jgi:hypothetical protein
MSAIDRPAQDGLLPEAMCVIPASDTLPVCPFEADQWTCSDHAMADAKTLGGGRSYMSSAAPSRSSSAKTARPARIRYDKLYGSTPRVFRHSPETFADFGRNLARSVKVLADEGQFPREERL